MSGITFTETISKDEIMERFQERYVDYEEIEVIMDMMENPELEMNWDNEGGIYVSITEKEKGNE